MTEPSHSLSITSLEVYQPFGIASLSSNKKQVLKTFLERITGLEDLYLSLPSPTDTKILWRAAAQHKRTLRRFIYHASTVNLGQESEIFEEEIDLNNMALLSDSFLVCLSDSEDYDKGIELKDDAWFTKLSPNPLGELTLECIGLACLLAVW